MLTFCSFIDIIFYSFKLKTKLFTRFLLFKLYEDLNGDRNFIEFKRVIKFY